METSTTGPPIERDINAEIAEALERENCSLLDGLLEQSVKHSDCPGQLLETWISVAITDHGSLPGVITLLNKARKILKAEHLKLCLNSAIVKAIELEDPKILEFLLEHGGDRNAVIDDQRSISLVHKAAEKDTTAFLDVVLKAGGDIDVRDIKQRHPLHHAASKGKWRNVEMLLDAGTDFTATDKTGNTALHCAVATGSAECIQVLLDAGSHINAHNELGSTPLHLCLQTGSSEEVCATFPILLEYKPDLSARDLCGNTPLHIACLNNKLDDRFISRLLEDGADPDILNNFGMTAMHAILRKLALDVPPLAICAIELYVDDTPDSFKKEYADVLSAVIDVAPITKEEVESLVTPDMWSTKVYFSCRRNLQILFDAGANINLPCAKDDVTPLHLAAKTGSFKLVILLLEHGADVEARDCNGFTPILSACSPTTFSINIPVGVVYAMLHHGAIATQTTTANQSCLHLLAGNNCSQRAMDAILDLGCPLNATDIHGQSSLHYACAKRPYENVLYLIKKGIDVNIKDNEDWSASCLLPSTEAAQFIVPFALAGNDFTGLRPSKNTSMIVCVFFRWIECIDTEGIVEIMTSRPFKLISPPDSLQIIFSRHPIEPHNLRGDIPKFVANCRALQGIKCALQSWFEEYLTEIPSLKSFCRATIRNHMRSGHSMTPKMKQFLTAKLVPQKIAEYIFMYKEIMRAFKHNVDMIDDIFKI